MQERRGTKKIMLKEQDEYYLKIKMKAIQDLFMKVMKNLVF